MKGDKNKDGPSTKNNNFLSKTNQQNLGKSLNAEEFSKVGG